MEQRRRRRRWAVLAIAVVAFADVVGAVVPRTRHHLAILDPATFEVHDLPADRVVPEDLGRMEEHELRDFLHQFEASRAALLSLVRDISAENLERKPNDAMWSVREALEHVMLTEASLLSRLEKWPADPYNTLQAVHRMAFQRFTIMEPADTALDHVVMGRRWTTRKVMRRILEHEFEHLGHIKEIVAALGGERPPD